MPIARWTKAAADKGNRNAQLNIGLFLEAGYGVPPDSAAALRSMVVLCDASLYRQWV